MSRFLINKDSYHPESSSIIHEFPIEYLSALSKSGSVSKPALAPPSQAQLPGSHSSPEGMFFLVFRFKRVREGVTAMDSLLFPSRYYHNQWECVTLSLLSSSSIIYILVGSLINFFPMPMRHQVILFYPSSSCISAAVLVFPAQDGYRNPAFCSLPHAKP